MRSRAQPARRDGAGPGSGSEAVDREGRGEVGRGREGRGKIGRGREGLGRVESGAQCWEGGGGHMNLFVELLVRRAELPERQENPVSLVLRFVQKSALRVQCNSVMQCNSVVQH